MNERKINPRLKSLADRLKDQSFLEKQAREENIRKLQEETEREEARKAQKEARRKAEEQNAYFKSLASLNKEEYDSSFQAFVSHPDFPVIYNQLEIITTVMDKWSFILRRAYEIGHEADIPIGFKFQHNAVETKRKLEDYGSYLLCPYFKEDQTSVTKEYCLIDGSPIASVCGGEHEGCVIFDDRARKAAAGMLALPVINRQEPKLTMEKIPAGPVDIRDLDDWWKQEGRYE